MYHSMFIAASSRVAAGEDDRADRGEQQQDRGGLEGEQELLEEQGADRRRVAEAGG